MNALFMSWSDRFALSTRSAEELWVLAQSKENGISHLMGMVGDNDRPAKVVRQLNALEGFKEPLPEILDGNEGVEDDIPLREVKKPQPKVTKPVGKTTKPEKPSNDFGDQIFDFLHDHKREIGHFGLIFTFVFLLWQGVTSNPNIGDMGFFVPMTLIVVLEAPDLALMVVLTILVLVLGSRERFSKLYVAAALVAAMSVMAGDMVYEVVNKIFYFITGSNGFFSVETVAVTAIVVSVGMTILEMMLVRKLDLTKTSSVLVASGLLFAAYSPITDTLRLFGLCCLFGGLGLQTIELLRKRETSATITVAMTGIPVLVLTQILLDLVLKLYLPVPAVWSWLLALIIALAITSLLVKRLASKVAEFFQLPERLMPISDPNMTDTLLFGVMIVSTIIVIVGHF